MFALIYVSGDIQEINAVLAMILALVCLAVAVIFFFYLKWEFSSYVKTIDLIPGPPKIPFFGNALSIPLDPSGKPFDLFIYLIEIYVFVALY